MADLSAATRDAVREGVKRSAAAVLPLVFEYVGTPDALLDVGAGEGHWLNAAAELGVPYLCGADISPSANVSQWDCERGEPLPMRIHLPEHDGATGCYTRWPLALCLEMAEHVSPQAGEHLVSELCRVADAVLFSAAVPGQGGDGHVNEQWPGYWHPMFAKHGYWLHDPGWRARLWTDDRCEPWYAHGLMLAIPGEGEPPLDLVHPVTWAYHRGVPAPGA